MLPLSLVVAIESENVDKLIISKIFRVVVTRVELVDIFKVVTIVFLVYEDDPTPEEHLKCVSIIPL